MIQKWAITAHPWKEKPPRSLLFIVGSSLGPPQTDCKAGMGWPYFFKRFIMQLPDSAYALIDELDRIFPERLPELGDELESIQRYAGKREVVLFLKQWANRSRQAAPQIRSRR